MTPGPFLTTALSRFDTFLLRAVANVVPLAGREDWRRTWQAELWHRNHRRPPAASGLAAGMLLDGCWLRVESWRCDLSGTASACIASLFAWTTLAALPQAALQQSQSWLTPALLADLRHCLFAASLVVSVALITNSSKHTTLMARPAFTLKRRAFVPAQVLHVVVLASLLSADICFPLHTAFPNPSDVLPTLFFVLLALIGLRWAIRDQEQRCKCCVRTLTAPARVGLPSHNLLEWNGTELTCAKGHGHLSVPEIETSWCQSSHWIDLNPA